MLSCGACGDCRDGRENLCLNAGVLGVTHWGGYAEYVRVRHDHVVRIPDSLSFEDAVAGQIPFATAWEALIEEIALRAGETVLITAAGGGVGSAAVQIAKLAGARVIAAAGSEEKLEKARALGADAAIDYTREDIGDAARRLTDGRGVDAALEMTGGAILVGAIDALAPGARLATIGAHGGERVEIDFIEFFRKHIAVHGCGRSTKGPCRARARPDGRGPSQAGDPPGLPLERRSGGSRADGEPQLLRPHDHAALIGAGGSARSARQLLPSPGRSTPAGSSPI